MWDSKAVIATVGMTCIGACAVILTLRSDVAHAMTFAALIVPSLAQLAPLTTKKDGGS